MANKQFYKFAKAYDIAFGDRDYANECNFVEWCFVNYGEPSGQEKSFLELACGPARHALELSKRNWRSFALDLSEEMLEYAKLISSRENAHVEFICADMVKFSIAQKVNVAASFTESISHILTNEDFIQHLKSVSECLLPGGVYVIESAHPYHFFPDDEPNEWTTSKDGMEVQLLFGHPDDDYDAVKQIWEISSSMQIKEGVKVEVIQSKSKHRWYLCQEIKALHHLAGSFSEIVFLGNMNIPPHALDNSDESESMIVVLKK